MVEISWVLACTASIRQERIGCPSSRMVQAPQTPCSQPIWVPASARSWRRKSLSSRRDSMRRLYDTPLTESVISCASMSIPHPPAGRLQRALGDNAGDMALIVRRRVDVAAGVDLRLHGRRNIADRCFRRLMPDQRAGCRTGIDGRLADPAKCEPNVDTLASIAECQRGRRTGDGEIAAPARNLHEAGAGAGFCRRQVDLDQHFIGEKIG